MPECGGEGTERPLSREIVRNEPLVWTGAPDDENGQVKWRDRIEKIIEE